MSSVRVRLFGDSWIRWWRDKRPHRDHAPRGGRRGAGPQRLDLRIPRGLGMAVAEVLGRTAVLALLRSRRITGEVALAVA